MKFIEYQPLVVIEREKDFGADDSFYALYAGEDLSSEYPNSYHFWIWINRAKLWERHAYDKKVETVTPDEDEIRMIVRYVFEAKSWDISS